MTEQQTNHKLEAFFARIPKALKVFNILDQHQVDWMIAGSGSLYLLGNEREPQDVDIFIPNKYHDTADQAFGIESFVYTSATENVRNSNPYGEHELQLTSGLKITVGDKVYDMEITEDVLAHRIKLMYADQSIWLMPPEDVLLIKAILQRGQEVGKHDIEDVTKFLSIYPQIRGDYLQQRIDNLQAADRVQNIFKL